MNQILGLKKVIPYFYPVHKQFYCFCKEDRPWLYGKQEESRMKENTEINLSYSEMLLYRETKPASISPSVTF
jgi:hypothetical protein